MVDGSKLVFRAYAYQDRGSDYAHAVVELGEVSPHGYLGQAILTLTWQCDRENDHWYGLHFEVRADHPEDLGRAHRLAARIERRVKAANDGYYTSSLPIVLAAVQDIASEVVHDDRLDRWVEVDRVEAGDLAAYSEDWQAAGLRGYYARVLADPLADGVEVRVKIIQSLSRDGNFPQLEKWLAAGGPIYQWTRCAAPDTRPLADRLAEFELWRRSA